MWLKNGRVFGQKNMPQRILSETRMEIKMRMMIMMISVNVALN